MALKYGADFSKIIHRENLDLILHKRGDLWICNICEKSNNYKSEAKRHAETHIDEYLINATIAVNPSSLVIVSGYIRFKSIEINDI